jgi:hybrid cluster-associated redox disulfide protein
MINENTYIEEIINKYPSSIKIFTKYKLPCFVCGEPAWGTIGEIARKYNIDVKKLINEIEKLKKSE